MLSRTRSRQKLTCTMTKSSYRLISTPSLCWHQTNLEFCLPTLSPSLPPSLRTIPKPPSVRSPSDHHHTTPVSSKTPSLFQQHHSQNDMFLSWSTPPSQNRILRIPKTSVPFFFFWLILFFFKHLYWSIIALQ